MTFRDREYDFDIYDADQAERYYAELEKVRLAGKQQEGEDSPGYIRRVCRAVFAFFDAVLGGDAHREIFGEKCNLRLCLDAFGAFNAAVEGQKGALDEMLAKYAPPRERRGGHAKG